MTKIITIDLPLRTKDSSSGTVSKAGGMIGASRE